MLCRRLCLRFTVLLWPGSSFGKNVAQYSHSKEIKMTTTFIVAGFISAVVLREISFWQSRIKRLSTGSGPHLGRGCLCCCGWHRIITERRPNPRHAFVVVNILLALYDAKAHREGKEDQPPWTGPYTWHLWPGAVWFNRIIFSQGPARWKADRFNIPQSFPWLPVNYISPKTLPWRIRSHGRYSVRTVRLCTPSWYLFWPGWSLVILFKRAVDFKLESPSQALIITSQQLKSVDLPDNSGGWSRKNRIFSYWKFARYPA